MKNLLYKIAFITFLIPLLIISCSKKSEIESIIVTNKNDYWEFRDYCWNTKGIYFHFNKNGSTDKYFLHVDDGFTLYENNQNKPILWLVKNDSTLVYNYSEYKIEKINKQEILLSYYHYKIKDKKCFVKLTKWVDGPEGPKPLDSVKVK